MFLNGARSLQLICEPNWKKAETFFVNRTRPTISEVNVFHQYFFVVNIRLQNSTPEVFQNSRPSTLTRFCVNPRLKTWREQFKKSLVTISTRVTSP